MEDAYPQFGHMDPTETMQYGPSVLVRRRLGCHPANPNLQGQLTTAQTKTLARECPGLLAAWRLTLACDKDKVAIG
jgi:hypothetical protein